MTGPVTPDDARAMIDRLRRMLASPGATVDATDRRALGWALYCCDLELGRIETAERMARTP